MRKLMFILAGTGILLAACAAPATPETVVERVTATPEVVVVTPRPSATATPTPTSTPRPTPTPRPWDHSDFYIELIVLEKECFGSAGCLIKVQPELFHRRESPPTGEYTLVFEIYGDEDGTIVQSAEIDGDMYTVGQVLVSTPNSDVEPTAEPTRLLDQ